MLSMCLSNSKLKIFIFIPTLVTVHAVMTVTIARARALRYFFFATLTHPHTNGHGLRTRDLNENSQKILPYKLFKNCAFSTSLAIILCSCVQLQSSIHDDVLSEKTYIRGLASLDIVPESDILNAMLRCVCFKLNLISTFVIPN